MSIDYFCIIIAIFIPIFCAGYAKFSVKGYNNRDPREFLKSLEGKAKRAHNAQLNSYETFAPFAIGILVAHQLQSPQQIINILAITFISARILFVFFYIKDNHVLRSCAWLIGLLATLSLFLINLKF